MNGWFENEEAAQLRFQLFLKNDELQKSRELSKKLAKMIKELKEENERLKEVLERYRRAESYYDAWGRDSAW